MRILMFTCVLGGLMAAASARAAMIHQYTFNDGTANDSIGGANGTLVNGASVQNGKLVFDPAINNGFNTDPQSGQYVDLPANIAHTRAMSLEVWFTWGGGNSWQRIVDFGNSTAGRLPPTDFSATGYTGGGFIILTPSNGNGGLLGQISINSWGGSADTDYTATTDHLVIRTQHHLVFTHDPDAAMQAIYLDGALRGFTNARVDPSTTQYFNWFIGRSNFYSDPFFNGSIDEFRIYNNGLSASQVAADYQAGPVPVPEPTAVLALPALGVLLVRRTWSNRPRNVVIAASAARNNPERVHINSAPG